MKKYDVYVYDKAKYHDATIEEYGLPVEHTYNHTTFFLAWIVQHDMLSDFMLKESGDMIEKYKKGECSINKLYEWWDTCFLSDMLNEEGDAFARAYFDFKEGLYLYDYVKSLKKNLPSEFHIEYTHENEKIIHTIIDKRYREWKSRRLVKLQDAIFDKTFIGALILVMIIVGICFLGVLHR